VVSFDRTDGALPELMTMAQSRDGKLCGTTVFNTGTTGEVFKVTAGGAITSPPTGGKIDETDYLRVADHPEERVGLRQRKR
jgi:hypothetical protein